MLPVRKLYIEQMFVSVRMQFHNLVDQGLSNTRAACGPGGHFVRLAGADPASNVRGRLQKYLEVKSHNGFATVRGMNYTS